MTNNTNAIEKVKAIIANAKSNSNYGGGYGFQSCCVEDEIAKLEDNITIEDRDVSEWNITFGEEGMPILAVHCRHPFHKDKETGMPEEYTGYLTPFRAYRFQVSETVSGQGDCGSSTVATDMYRLAEMGDLGAKALEGMAMYAMCRAGAYISGIKDRAMFDTFIALSAAYLRERKDHIIKCYGA